MATHLQKDSKMEILKDLHLLTEIGMEKLIPMEKVMEILKGFPKEKLT